MDLTFTAAVVDRTGKEVEKELIENGKNIYVTRENVAEYLELYAHFVLVDAIQEQLAAFAKGFFKIIPQDMIAASFSARELEYVIRGVPKVDIDDLKKNTVYVRCSANSPAVQYFWQAVEEFTEEEHIKLVQFFSGSSRAPPGGFAYLQPKFNIMPACKSHESLPKAHTCDNAIELPDYLSAKESLRKIRQAITMTVGFAFD